MQGLEALPLTRVDKRLLFATTKACYQTNHFWLGFFGVSYVQSMQPVLVGNARGTRSRASIVVIVRLLIIHHLIFAIAPM